MTDWLIASNPATFDVESAFHEMAVIDWSEASTAHLRSGDRVFLYQARPVQAITHVCEVIRTGIESPDMLDDRKYWRDASALEHRRKRTWMRLSLLLALPQHDQALLTLDHLREAGLKSAPQGRMRAPEAITALISEVLEQHAPDASELIQRENDLVVDLDIERPAWRFQKGRRGGTQSHASFTYALSMPDAPTALAMLRTYLKSTGLDQTERWSVSAMPSWGGATGHQRFATVNGAGIELFYVWFESSTGIVTEWGTWIPPELTSTIPPLDALWQSTAKNGDTGIHGETLADLLDALADQPFLEALRATSEQRQGARRADRHNPYLGALLGASGAHVDDEPEPITDEDVEFERRYIERVTRHRLHQGPLRDAALRKYGAQCMYCELDVPEVLEAAHLIADSKGGAASTDNIRILCANHHSAFDAGLLRFDGEQFTPAPGAPEVLPYEATSASISDVDRLLLFEWHANHLLSWVDEFASGKLVWNVPKGASTRDFHRTAITAGLLRKFYTPSEPIALPNVVRSIGRLHSGSDPILRKKLNEVSKNYRGYLRVPMKVEGEGVEAVGADLIYDLIYGLLIHGDVDRGRRIRRRGRYVLHGSAILQKGWETVVEALRTIEMGREEGTLALPDRLEPLW